MMDVFVSAGRPMTSDQEKFLSALEDLLRSSGLNPRTLGRNDFSSISPLVAIEELMGKCSGTVVVAYERILIDSGVQYSGWETKTPLARRNLPTVWNQIEATMAYSFDHPLLVIVEKGLKQEGLLSNNRDWFVQEVAIRPETMQDREFQGIFFHWRLRVEKFGTGGGRQRTNANDRVDVNSMTASELLRSMTPAQVWSVGSALASVVLGVAYIAFKIGQSGVSP